MMYLIKDIITSRITGHSSARVVKVAETEYEAFDFLKDEKNLKLFKGDIKIDKVIL